MPVDQAWALKRQLPDARLFVAPDCGHEVQARRTALFNEALSGFYRSTAAVAATAGPGLIRAAEPAGGDLLGEGRP